MVFGNAHATRVSGDSPLRVELDGGPVVHARAVVIATNTPFNYLVATHTKQAAYHSYVLGFRVAGSLPHHLWWDLEDPFHYVRLHRPADGGAEIAIVGGEDHKTGQSDVDPKERWARLEAWARRHVPGLGEVAHRWSGQVMESIDGLAFIGRVEQGREVFVVTGDCGNGMTHGTIAALLLPDLIQGRPHPWSDVYDPTRLRLRALGRFAQENLNVAARYAAWLAPASASSADAIRPGSGAVVRRGLSPVAVYRDGDGVVHERSAVCPHLGCIVAWNAAERTWDCPCHGSVFAPTGEVLHGPAARGLAPVEGRKDGGEGESPRHDLDSSREPPPGTEERGPPDAHSS
jgi:nitrite reductase/ring-hydroxylating ferredoxin subunit